MFIAPNPNRSNSNHNGTPPKPEKLTARERIEVLLDSGRFFELDKDVVHRATGFGLEDKRHPGDGVITGFGTVEGRTVYVFSQDFSIIGGTVGQAHARKICKVMDLAAKAGRKKHRFPSGNCVCTTSNT